MKAKYGSAAYAMEELRAELANAFLLAELGIPSDIPQHASYISSWLKPLKEEQQGGFQSRSRCPAHRGHGAWVPPGVSGSN